MMPGTIVRYTGAQHPCLAGMEGYVMSVEPFEPFGPFEGVWVMWAPFRETDRTHVNARDLRELRAFSKDFAKKYPTPAFGDVTGPDLSVGPVE